MNMQGSFVCFVDPFFYSYYVVFSSFSETIVYPIWFDDLILSKIPQMKIISMEPFQKRLECCQTWKDLNWVSYYLKKMSRSFARQHFIPCQTLFLLSQTCFYKRYLGGNNFTGSIPVELEKLTLLKVCTFGERWLIDRLIDLIDSFTKNALWFWDVRYTTVEVFLSTHEFCIFWFSFATHRLLTRLIEYFHCILYERTESSHRTSNTT